MMATLQREYNFCEGYMYTYNIFCPFLGNLIEYTCNIIHDAILFFLMIRLMIIYF